MCSSWDIVCMEQVIFQAGIPAWNVACSLQDVSLELRQGRTRMQETYQFDQLRISKL